MVFVWEGSQKSTFRAYPDLWCPNRHDFVMSNACNLHARQNMLGVIQHARRDKRAADFGLIWGSKGVKKRFQKGIDFSGEKWSPKNLSKIETNRAQEGITIIGLSYSGPIWSLGDKGGNNQLPTMLVISPRHWAKGPANFYIYLCLFI